MNETDRQVLTVYGPGAYLVGGAVRDETAGVDPKDRDYLVIGMDVPQLSQRALECGLSVQHNHVNEELVGVRVDGVDLPRGGVEVSPPRTEISVGPKHTDFQIRPVPLMVQRGSSWGSLLQQDLSRRDWTVNAMARNLRDDQLVDPYDGQQDLIAGSLKLVFPHALLEDPLRILRGFSLVSRLGLTIRDREAVQEAKDGLRHISRERVGDEMRKLMLGGKAWMACSDMFIYKIWDNVLPMLTRADGFDQESKYHDDLLHEHLVNVLYHVSRHETEDGEDDKLALRWAALLHDVGKPFTAWRGRDEKLHYYRDPDDPAGVSHEEAGELLTAAGLDSLRYPTYVSKRAAALVRHHMINPSSKTSAGRRFRREVCDDSLLEDVLALRRADITAKEKPGVGQEEIKKSLDALDHFSTSIALALDQPCFVRELAVDGYDMKLLGLEGKQIGDMLNELLNQVVGDPDLNYRGWLMTTAEHKAKKLLASS